MVLSPRARDPSEPPCPFAAQKHTPAEFTRNGGLYGKRRIFLSRNKMDEVITGCVNPLFMGPTVRLDLTTVLEATGELQHFLDLGAARLRAEGPLSQEASETLIFGLADELESYLRAMGSKQGSAGIEDLRVWTRTWIDEQQGALAEKLLREGARETTP